MQKLYEITIPGLSMKADLPAIRDRLLADFPRVIEVLSMTTPATVLIVYRGEEEVDAWIDALSDSVRAPVGREALRSRVEDSLEVGEQRGSTG
jgi:hypothetical protein